MGPKKPNIVDDDFWKRNLEATPLDETSWTVKVILIECAGSDQDRIYLSKFETIAAEEKRFVIKNISKTETIFMINQLGGEKKVKDDSMRVFEEGQLFLKDKKDVPSELMALIIKHLILKMKDEYLFIQKQRLQVREGLRRESKTMIDKTEIKGTANTKSHVPVEEEKIKKGKKEDAGNAIPSHEPEEGKKYNTQLRVRGEEWRDKVYVDDFPVDGPSLYVAITGFQDADLPGCLVKIGIPLTAVVQIRIDTTGIRVPSTLSRPTKRGQSQTEILMEKSLKFWEDLQLLRIIENSDELLKNTAFIIFTPPYWDESKLSGNADKIYDEISYLMYDVQDLSRQHLHYLTSMDIIEIPIENVDLQYSVKYSKLIEDLPLESVTTFSVLDSVLNAVCEITEGVIHSANTSLSFALTINTDKKTTEKNQQAEHLVKSLFNKLTDSDSETNRKTYRQTYGDEFENYKDPVIINYGDFAKDNTFHLGNINLDNIVHSMLFNMPIHKLWHRLPKPQHELEAKINYHVNVLLSCFHRKDIETSEISRLLHILACRKLYNNRSSNRKQHVFLSTNEDFKKVYLKRSILAEPLPKSPSVFYSSASMSPSFPSVTKIEDENIGLKITESETNNLQFLFECPDISELVSAAEINSDKPIGHMIDEFDYFEDLFGISSFQMLQNVFNLYNCVDYKYCEVTDSIILMFYNSHDRDGIAREEWRSHLPTPVCLQDFLDFVLEENYDWIVKEEVKYEDKLVMKKLSECKELTEVFATTSCTDNLETGADLLMEGSLKHHQYLEMLEDQTDFSELKTISEKSSMPLPIDSDLKLGKKGKTPISSTPKSGARRMTVATISDRHHFGEKPFSGYDLGDRRVELLGKDSIFYSKDGTKVTVKYYMAIPMNKEFASLCVAPGNGNSVIHVHKALGDFIHQDHRDVNESFRITCKDGVLINVLKQTCEMSLLDSSNINDYNKPIETTLEPPAYEIKNYHSVLITWPNGLIIESIHENNNPKISHIKQYYLTEKLMLNEEMRCISRLGEVIIFKNNGQIEVLRPDGSFISILNCEKRIVLPEATESVSGLSVSTSDKGKGQKSKLKASKSTLKASKSIIDTPEKVCEKPVYELHIGEYELIGTNGIKQKYKDGTFTDIDKILIRTAAEYNLGEVFTRRMDGTNILINKDGVQTVTFSDGTRIITRYVIEENEIYPEWTEDEKRCLGIWNTCLNDREMSFKGSVSLKSYYSTASSYSRLKEEDENEEELFLDEGYVSVIITFTVEHPNFGTVNSDPATGNLKIDSPNNTSVTVKDSYYNIKLDDVTMVTFNGEKLHIDYEACVQCASGTVCDINICKNKDESDDDRWWLKMKDSYSKQVLVDEEGGLSIFEEPPEEEYMHTDETHHTEDIEDGKSDASFLSHGQCRAGNIPKKLKFFVLRRDLTCSELVHHSLVEEYKMTCRWQPWCSINDYDAFGDHRQVLSVLSPVHLNESEKWLMDSKLAGKPRYLAFKDLKKDEGKGFYHWMRPYDRFEPTPMKPANVLPPRLPRAFVLRTLEQQWNDSNREAMKGGRELLEAILKYRKVMEADCADMINMPVLDFRLEKEKRQDKKVQEFAHRIYVETKNRLDDDIQLRMSPDITTKPAVFPDQLSIGFLTEEASLCESRILEERESQVEELDEAEAMSPNRRKYWRVRAEEAKEEQFYKYLLRQSIVPPYFRNVLGGAIWWEVMNAAGDAVNIAENVSECNCCEETFHEPHDLTR